MVETPRLGRFDELEAEEAHPGVVRRAFSTKEATVTAYTFEPGAAFPLHCHPQEQVTLVQEGTVEMTVDRETMTLDAGAWSVVPGWVEHGITAGPSGARVVAVVVPARENSDAYELADRP